MRKVEVLRSSEDAERRRNMARLRAELTAAAVEYVRRGTELTRGDRVRAASDLSGLPARQLDAEARR